MSTSLTASRGLSIVSYQLNDLVEYRTGLHGSWRPGFVEAIEGHSVVVRDFFWRRRYVIQLGQQGRIRCYSGPHLVEDVESYPKLARDLPQIQPVIVRADGTPR